MEAQLNQARMRRDNGLLPTPVFDQTNCLFNIPLSDNQIISPRQAWSTIRKRMLLNLSEINNMPFASIAKCALFPNNPIYAMELQILFEELYKQIQHFTDRFNSNSTLSVGISSGVQSTLSRELRDIIPTMSLLIVLSSCEGVPDDVTYVLPAIAHSTWKNNVSFETMLQGLTAQHRDLTRFILNIHQSLTDWPIFQTRFKCYFKQLLIPVSVGEFHVKMILIRETTMYLSQFFKSNLSADSLVSRPVKTAKRVCPRCIHGIILLVTSVRIHNIPDPVDTSVCDLTPENLKSTLYPDEDQAADFMLVLTDHGLTSQQLAHFSHECPLIRSECFLTSFSQQYTIPLKQLIHFKREILKLMRRNKTCPKCGRIYSGSKYPPLPDHASCSFWDSETSSISTQSRFVSTLATNNKPQ